jgi:hypothetical protein
MLRLFHTNTSPIRSGILEQLAFTKSDPFGNIIVIIDPIIPARRIKLITGA